MVGSQGQGEPAEPSGGLQITLPKGLQEWARIMRRSSQFLAGSALCLLMTAPLSVENGEAADFFRPDKKTETVLMLAQAGEAPPAQNQECPPGTVPGEGGCIVLEERPQPAEPETEVPPEEQPPAMEPEPQVPVEPAPEAAPEPPPAEAVPEQAPEPPVDPTPEAEPPAELAPEAAPESPAEAVPEAAPEPPAEAVPEAAPEPPAELAPDAAADPTAEPAPEVEESQQDEAPAAIECPPGTELSASGECVAIGDEAAPAETPSEQEPVDEAPSSEEPAETEPEVQQPAPTEDLLEEEAPTQPAPGEEAPVVEEPSPQIEEEPSPQLEELEPEPETPQEEQPETLQEELGAEEPQPATPAEEVDEEVLPEAEALTPEEAAPVQPEAGEQAEEPEAAPDQPPTEEVFVPEDDAQAQQELQDILEPEEVQQEVEQLVQEEGRRIELGQTPEDIQVRRREIFQRRENARVIRQYEDNRTIIEINNNIFINNPGYDRIVRRGDTVWYEELRGGRVREVIERGDGTRVITVRNRYGDVIRRVRVTPDGRQYVLAFVPERRFDAILRFEDPARELPPFRLTVPVNQYILEAEVVQEPRRYYEFLSKPPIEPVRRIYSVEEVRYSERVRVMMPRIDLTIEFEFGSARIEEDQIPRLEALAQAMQRILDEDPAETFLIEGHTDAVGSEVANLALSDRRAEAVARVLTDVFDIPPENMVTQGYGEKYLKVNTQAPERKNRRVAVRRITPLVAPVASR